MDVGDIHGFHVFLKTEFDRLHSFARSYRAEHEDSEASDPVPLSATLVTVGPVAKTMNAFLEELGKREPEYQAEVKNIIDEYLKKEKAKKIAEIKIDE